MGYFAAAKRDRELNTLALANKAPDVLDLEVDIVFRGERAHLYFFDRVRGGVTLGVVLLFFLRVSILVEVGNPADRRARGGGNFNQVEPFSLCGSQSVGYRQDTDL